MQKIEHIVYTPDLNMMRLCPDYQGETIEVLDPRSAVYVANGIAAQTKETVMVFVKSDNSSRSAFSGMTEAFYRNLPVILVTVGSGLNYELELKDVVNSHIVLESLDYFEPSENLYPMHIELNVEREPNNGYLTSVWDVLKEAVNIDDYVYASKNAGSFPKDFPCKAVIGGMEGCREGSLANVLGASLAKRHRRYIGIVDEEEFLHDMNTLGNTCVSDSLVYVILTDNHADLIKDYAGALGFEVFEYLSGKSESTEIERILWVNKKTLILFREVQV